MNSQSITSVIAVAITLTSVISNYYQWRQNKHGKIKIKVEPDLTHLILTFINIGPVEVLLSSESGFITPKKKTVLIEDAGAGRYQYPRLVAIHQSFVLEISVGSINQHLFDLGFKGSVKIRFFIRDEAGRLYKSEFWNFAAEDVNKICT